MNINFNESTESERSSLAEIEQLKARLNLSKDQIACPKCKDILNGKLRQERLHKCTCGYLMLDATDEYYRLSINE